MARVTAFGQPANDVSERSTTCAVIYRIPMKSYLEIKDKEVFEIDLVLLAPQCVFVVDIKGTHGHIEVYGSKWHPENRQPYHSPVAKLRQHAKILSSLI